MTSAQYTKNECFRYYHKRRVAHCRQCVALFCSHEPQGRGPRTCSSCGASGSPTPQPDGIGWTSCGQEPILGCRSLPSCYSQTLRSSLGVWVLLSGNFWLKAEITSDFLETCAATFPLLSPFTPAGGMKLEINFINWVFPRCSFIPWICLPVHLAGCTVYV